EPLGVRHPERPQQQGVDDAEDGGGGADSKRQRKDRDGGENGGLRQAANRIPEILQRLVERDRPHVSHLRPIGEGKDSTGSFLRRFKGFVVWCRSLPDTRVPRTN